jgi:hypothetical protein
LNPAIFLNIYSKKLNLLKSQGFKLIPNPFKGFLIDLWQLISEKGEDDMTLLDLSPQQIEKIDKMWGDVLLPTLPIDKRLAGLNFTEVINYLKREQIFSWMTPEQIVAGMTLEQRLAGLSIEEIEAYLEQKKQS